MAERVWLHSTDESLPDRRFVGRLCFSSSFFGNSEYFEEMIVKRYEDMFRDEGQTIELTVDEVRLGYMRYPEQRKPAGGHIGA